MVSKPVKSKTIFYDGQEPTTNDLNYVQEASFDQITIRDNDRFTDGVIRGANKFTVTANLLGNTLSVSVGPGVAYINGNRVEISYENTYNYLPPNESWARVDADNVPIPRSTGNLGIQIPKPTGNNLVGIFIAYLDEVPFDPNTGDPIAFCIDPVTYKRNYTARRNGYIIGYSEYPNSQSVILPENPPNVTWLHLAEIAIQNNQPVINQSVMPFVTIRSEVAPDPAVSVHNYTHHTDGITYFSLMGNQILEYVIQTNRLINTFINLTNGKTTTFTFTGTYTILYGKLAVFNNSGNSIPTSVLTIRVNNQDATILESAIPPGHSVINFSIQNAITSSPITLYVQSTNVSILGVGQDGNASELTAQFMQIRNISYIYNRLLWDLQRNNDCIIFNCGQIGSTQGAYVVEGNVITTYFYKGNVLFPGQNVLDIDTTIIPNQAGTYDRYLYLDKFGNLKFTSSSSSGLLLMSIQFIADSNWADHGGLRLKIKSIPVVSVNSICKEIRLPSGGVPICPIPGTTSSGFFLSYKSDHYDSFINPLAVWLSNDGNNMTKLQISTAGGEELLSINQTNSQIDILNSTIQNCTISSQFIFSQSPVNNGFLISNAQGKGAWKSRVELNLPILDNLSSNYIPMCSDATNLILQNSPIQINPTTNSVGINGSPSDTLHVIDGNILLNQNYLYKFNHATQTIGLGFNTPAVNRQRISSNAKAIHLSLPTDTNDGFLINIGSNTYYELCKDSDTLISHNWWGNANFYIRKNSTEQQQIIIDGLNSDTPEYNMMVLNRRSYSRYGNGSSIVLQNTGNDGTEAAGYISGMIHWWTNLYDSSLILGLDSLENINSELASILAIAKRDGTGQVNGVDIGFSIAQRRNRGNINVGKLHVYQSRTNYSYGIVSEGVDGTIKAFVAQHRSGSQPNDYYIVYADGQVEFPNPNVSLPASAGTAIVLDSNNRLRRASSSLRYKTNIKPLHIDSSCIYQLNPKSFEFIAQPGTKTFGLIAEEVNEICSDLVHKTKTGECESIDYFKLIVLMLEEIKNLHYKLNQHLHSEQW